MGSGSKGVKIINSIEDIKSNSNKTLYLEKYIKGEHYNVYFIDNQICTLIKPPLSNEHVDMEKIETPDDISEVIRKWKSYLGNNALFWTSTDNGNNTPWYWGLSYSNDFIYRLDNNTRGCGLSVRCVKD